MRILEIFAGGFGSRCTPGRVCGRRPKSLKHRDLGSLAILKEAQIMYKDDAGFRVLLQREIREAFPFLLIPEFDNLTPVQKMTVARRVHYKAQDRYRYSMMKSRPGRAIGTGGY